MFSKRSGEHPSSPATASNSGRERMASKSNSTFSVLGSDLSITGDIMELVIRWYIFDRPLFYLTMRQSYMEKKARNSCKSMAACT